MVVGKRKSVWVRQYGIDAGSRFQVDANVCSSNGTKGTQRAVHIPRTDIENPANIGCRVQFEKRLAEYHCAWMHMPMNSRKKPFQIPIRSSLAFPRG